MDKAQEKKWFEFVAKKDSQMMVGDSNFAR